jgi:hypothetical protein
MSGQDIRDDDRLICADADQVIRSAQRLTWLAGVPAVMAILAARDWRGNGRKANPWPIGHSIKEPSYG